MNSHARYVIQELNRPPDTNHTEVHDLNASGDVCGVASMQPASSPTGGGSDLFYGYHGVIWGSAGPLIMAERTILNGINDTGDAVGATASNGDAKAFLLRGGFFTDLSTEVGLDTQATGINNFGLICGDKGNRNAFVFNPGVGGTTAEINPLPGGSTAQATAISQSGQVVGVSDGGERHGFLYSEGTLTDLGPAASVEDINESGQICGSIGNQPESKPRIWDVSQASPTFTDIPVPGGFLGAQASGINSNRQVVGRCWTSPQALTSDDTSAYIYSNGTSTDLNTLITDGSGWKLQSATKINDAGQIAGTGQYMGQQRAFLLTPTSTPSHGQPWRSPILSLPELVAILTVGGVRVDGGGWVVLPGGHPIPVDPWGPLRADMPVEKRDALLSFALDELAKNIEDAAAREAVRRTVLETLRKQVDRMLETL